MTAPATPRTPQRRGTVSRARVRCSAVPALLLACLAPASLAGQAGRAEGTRPSGAVVEPDARSQDEGGRENPDRDVALQPGVSVGLAVGVAGFGGPSNDAIAAAPRFDSFVAYALASGLLLRAGLHVSGHRIEPLSHPYGLFGVYVEPRYVALGISRTWAPWIAGHAGRVLESADRRAVRLSASGWTLGVGGGAMLRVAPQVALEGGVLYGVVRFGDYTFRGERAWYECLNLLDEGTTLPESVLQCDSAFDIAVVLCYPPFYPSDYRLSGNCQPPDVPYAGTGRSGTWLRAWIGVTLSFAFP